MSKKTLRNLIVSVLLLMISAAAFTYMVFELNSKNMLLKEQVIALQTKQAQENSYFKLQRISETSSADRETLAGYFFEQESDSIDFLNAVEALAPQVGISLKTETLVPGGDKKKKESWVLVSFLFTGEYKNVTDFIKILENLPYESQIDSLQLSSREDSGWEARTTMRINVYAYDEKK